MPAEPPGGYWWLMRKLSNDNRTNYWFPGEGQNFPVGLEKNFPVGLEKIRSAEHDGSTDVGFYGLARSAGGKFLVLRHLSLRIQIRQTSRSQNCAWGSQIALRIPKVRASERCLGRAVFCMYDRRYLGRALLRVSRELRDRPFTRLERQFSDNLIFKSDSHMHGNITAISRTADLLFSPARKVFRATARRTWSTRNRGGGFIILAWSKCLNNEFTEDKHVELNTPGASGANTRAAPGGRRASQETARDTHTHLAQVPIEPEGARILHLGGKSGRKRPQIHVRRRRIHEKMVLILSSSTRIPQDILSAHIGGDAWVSRARAGRAQRGMERYILIKYQLPNWSRRLKKNHSVRDDRTWPPAADGFVICLVPGCAGPRSRDLEQGGSYEAEKKSHHVSREQAKGMPVSKPATKGRLVSPAVRPSKKIDPTFLGVEITYLR
ncbi:hypothetical protein DFH08DRAFT_799080 [Mycena albidolilacea]|uniref:Uncharacterized protein n=1 Tax=Mycena albidolilacea TaxID=1033008 RepID=A0AAD7F4D8_9AGAR|nr:hypothetical protein DFH08DRAFT_799080 [Mycena albidolilacea]